MKTITGDKHAYATMAINLCKANNGSYKCGDDNGYKDGYKYERRFKIQKDGENDGIVYYLAETKSSPHMADFTRYWRYLDADNAERYMVEAPTKWEH